MMKHKPTREECRIIRDCAERDSGFDRVEICPSTKFNTKDRSKPTHMNWLMVSNDTVEQMFDPEHNCTDTDLADNSYNWKDFTRGVELTDAGDGIFDFYVYGPLGFNKELQTNVTAYYKASRLIRVDGVPNVCWNLNDEENSND